MQPVAAIRGPRVKAKVSVFVKAAVSKFVAGFYLPRKMMLRVRKQHSQNPPSIDGPRKASAIGYDSDGQCKVFRSLSKTQGITDTGLFMELARGFQPCRDTALPSTGWGCPGVDNS